MADIQRIREDILQLNKISKEIVAEDVSPSQLSAANSEFDEKTTMRVKITSVGRF